MKKKKKNRMLSKFLKVFIMTFMALLIVIGIGTGVYLLISNNFGFAKSGDKAKDKNNEKVEELNKITTFAVFGLDEAKFRTDVIMLVFFNKDTHKTNIVSIPRDTMVSIPDDIYAEILERRSGVKQTIKINEVPAYVEAEDRNEASVRTLEKTLGINIDYYMSMDLEGFKEIVDIVGPIPVEIPFDMNYSDPFQDLYINLPAGLQELDGDQAEQLVRFRKGYANGDLGRIDMQHEFMKSFMNKLLTMNNKMNILNIAKAALVYLETDFTAAIDYIGYVDDIKAENMTIETLPGESKTIDRSYYILDPEATRVMLDNIMNAIGEATPLTSEEMIDIKTLNISVQNGTYISGFAGRVKNELVELGYQITEVIDHKEKPITTTKILIPNENMKEELAEYFNNPEFIVDSSLMEETNQIIIILGESDGE